MNRDQKAAVVDEVATQIQDSGAVFAIDYRGLSVTQAVELRIRLGEADASFRVVKNRLTLRAADKAGAEPLKELLEGPTAFAFVRGDPAVAAKAVATFRREHQLLEFKGGTLAGEPLSAEQLESISKLPARDALNAQFVGVVASPLTGLVRGLGSLIQGLALQLGQLQEQGLLGGGGQAASGAEADGDASGQIADGGGEAAAAEASGEQDEDAAGEGSDAEAPGDPVAEAEQADTDAQQADADAQQADTEQAETSAETDGTDAESSDEQPDASDGAEAKEE